METLLEIIMEIVMEGTLYTAGNKKFLSGFAYR